eukprot:4513511-Prymnesium_polylepis.1
MIAAAAAAVLPSSARKPLAAATAPPAAPCSDLTHAHASRPLAVVWPGPAQLVLPRRRRRQPHAAWVVHRR